jgi:hypothetical protein
MKSILRAITCFIFGHKWTSKAMKNIPPTETELRSYTEFKHYAKMYCDRRGKDALRFGIEEHGWDEMSKDYLEGALHEAERAAGLVDALEVIGNGSFPITQKELEEWLLKTKRDAREVLVKYKEVKLQTLKNCIIK